MLQRTFRRPAVKLWIENINKGKPVFDAGRFIGIEFKNQIISRVNIVANVIDKFEGENFAIATIDDSTGITEIRDFENRLKDIEVGDVIMVIGTLRNYNEKVYINREIIKKLSPLWLIARKLELEKIFNLKESEKKEYSEREQEEYSDAEVSGKVSESEIIGNEIGASEVSEAIEGKKVDEAKAIQDEIIKETVLEEIKNLEKNSGEVSMEELFLKLNFPIQHIRKAIEELIDEARVYEPRPGILKLF